MGTQIYITEREFENLKKVNELMKEMYNGLLDKENIVWEEIIVDLDDLIEKYEINLEKEKQ